MPGDLRLAVRVAAETGQAVRNVRQLNREIEGSGRTTARAGAEARRGAAGYAAVDAAVGRSSRTARDARRRYRAAGSAAARSGQQARRGAAGYDQFARSTERAGATAGALGGRLVGIAAGYVSIRAALSVVDGITQSTLALEGFEQRLLQATGTGRAAGEEMRFVRREADRLGLSLPALAHGYSGLAAASRGTRLEGENTRQIFLAIAEASRVLNLDAAQTQGALTAVDQIISKGRVSAEELRGQLGERLPGAFQIAARAMGLTTVELDKMLEQGSLLSEDFLPRFATQLRTEFGASLPAAIDNSAAAFARLENSVFDLETAIGNSGLVDFLADAADGATRLLDAVSGADDTPANPLQALEGQLAAVRAGIAETEERLRTFRQAGVVSDVVTGQVQADLEALRAQEQGILVSLSELRRLAARVPDAALDEVVVEGEAAEQAVTAAQRRIEAIVAQSQARIAQAREDRIGAARIAEERLLAEIERLSGEEGVTEQAVQRARLAVREATAAQIKRIEGDAADEAERAAKRRADAHEAAARRIARAQADLGDDVAAARQDARAWADAVLAGLDRQRAGYEALAATVEEVVLERTRRAVAEAEEEQLRSATDLRSGAIRAFRTIARESEDAAGAMERAVTGAARAGTDALAEFATTGRTEVGRLVQSIVADFARLQIQQNITGPLFAGLQGLFGLGAPAQPAPVVPGFYHGGGDVGRLGGRRRAVDPRVFLGAPRAHAGLDLRSGEVPIVAERGERVLSREETAAYGRRPDVTVNVINRGTPQEARVEDFRVDGRRWVLDIVLDDVQRHGQIPRALQQVGAL